MEELINRIVAHVGLDAAVARKSVGMMLGFLQQSGDADKVSALIGALDGGAEAVAEANYQQGFMPGVMGLGSQLMQNGLGMSEITGVAKETIRYGREKVGAAEIDEMVASVPGLGQFI
jgi:hypothetical protein